MTLFFKKFLFLIILLTVCIEINAQVVTEDFTQVAQNATMISQNGEIIKTAVQQFKQMKQIYQQGNESYREFVQIKDFIKASEDRLANIGDIKQLRLNNISIILDRVFCIKQGNYFPGSVRFLEIIRKIKAGFLNCDNRELYNKTFTGVLDQFDARANNALQSGGKELTEHMNELNKSLKQADETHSVLSSYNSRMKLELGLKYKAISDDLMELSEEVHLAINEDAASDKNIALSPADRLKMMDMANQYQIQAMQFEEKSAQLLKEASEMDVQQQKKILEMKRDIAMKQMINFSL